MSEARLAELEAAHGPFHLGEDSPSCEAWPCAIAELVAEVRQLQAALRAVTPKLSLLRSRCANTIPWGTPGIYDQYEVDEALGQASRALGWSP